MIPCGVAGREDEDWLMVWDESIAAVKKAGLGLTQSVKHEQDRVSSQRLIKELLSNM